MKRESIYKTLKKAYGSFSGEHKVKFWVSLLLLFISSLIELVGLAALLPLFYVMLKDNFIEHNEILNDIYIGLHFKTEFSFIIFLSSLLVLVMVVKNLLSALILRYHSKFTFALYQYFSTNLYKYFYNLGYLNFKQHNSNFIASYINNHPSFFAQFFVLPILTLANEFMVLLMIVFVMLIYSPSIFLLLIATVLPLFLLTYIVVRKKIAGVGVEKAKYTALLNKSIHQAVEGYIDIKSLHKEEYFFEEYRALVNSNTKLGIKSIFLTSLPTKVIEIGMVLGLICLLLFGLYFIGDKEKIGTLLGVFAIAAYRILPSVNRIMAAIISAREHQYTVEVITLIKQESSDEIFKSSTSNLIFNKEIQIEKICFSYNASEKTLDDLSFSVKKGETIGLIGRSGSGKTTLINLLLRFLQEQSGTVKVDGQLIDGSMVNAWRKMIGYVQQSVYIIDGSIAENIAFGIAPDKIDFDKIKIAIEAASLTELVEKLPDGMFTKVGERGAQLSGGQRQRLGIARALYSEALVLLFDEATSALDNETEAEITEAIRKLAEQNLTMVIIAHRYSTLKYCNRIIEMEGGKIINTLSYSELSAKSKSI